MSRTIVVGVDGSEGSDRALEWCAVNAPKLDAEWTAALGDVRHRTVFVEGPPGRALAEAAGRY